MKRMMVIFLVTLAAMTILSATALADGRPVWPTTTTMSSGSLK